MELTPGASCGGGGGGGGGSGGSGCLKLPSKTQRSPPTSLL